MPRRSTRAASRQPGPDQPGRCVLIVAAAPADPAATGALLHEVVQSVAEALRHEFRARRHRTLTRRSRVCASREEQALRRRVLNYGRIFTFPKANSRTLFIRL